jgi:hypothetical protein
MGVAMALSARELVIVFVFSAFLGRRAFDKRSVLAILKSFSICAAVVATHVSLARLGPARLLVDGVLYAALALVLGVVRPRDLVDVLRLVRDRKKIQAEA